MKTRMFLFVSLVVLASLILSGCMTAKDAAEACGGTENVKSFTAFTVTCKDTAAPAAATQEPVAEPRATEPPAESAATEAPAEKGPADLPCDSIQVSFDEGKTWQEAGLRLENESKYNIGGRVTFTARSVVEPKVDYDQPLTPEQLKNVEQTWMKVRLNPCGKAVVVFTGGINIKGNLFNDGALFRLDGPQEFRLRNGEIIIWDDEEHLVKDIKGYTDESGKFIEGRLSREIRNGNFDIKSRLGLAVSDSLKSLLPADIAEGVQTVIFK